MEAGLMFRTAVVLLALTGAGGLLMAGLRFSGRPRPPHWMAMGHGLLAGSGLTLILYAGIVSGFPGGAALGLALLVLAALGGLMLNLRYHVNGLALPVWMVLVHAAIAVIGLVVLAIAVWK
jgi:hypothetical protein